MIKSPATLPSKWFTASPTLQRAAGFLRQGQ
jgi:hypothetical protein